MDVCVWKRGSIFKLMGSNTSMSQDLMGCDSRSSKSASGTRSFAFNKAGTSCACISGTLANIMHGLGFPIKCKAEDALDEHRKAIIQTHSDVLALVFLTELTWNHGPRNP